MNVSVVITSFNQGDLIAEAVASAWDQSLRPARVIVVDDGSDDPVSLDLLDRLDAEVIRQPNKGVSAARNRGIGAAADEFVVVLDGDDRLAPTFIERTAAVLLADEEMIAASSWLQTHGVMNTIVRPPGGRAADFLARNACPATALIRRDGWARCGGYNEEMRSGFEDWDFFLALLTAGGTIGIVPEPLIGYRTAPSSANVRSMASRTELYGQIIDRHRPLFEAHLRETLLTLDARATDAHRRSEELLVRHRDEPLGEVTYGDGGMAAAVRIATDRLSDKSPARVMT